MGELFHRCLYDLARLIKVNAPQPTAQMQHCRRICFVSFVVDFLSLEQHFYLMFLTAATAVSCCLFIFFYNIRALLLVILLFLLINSD